MASSGKKKNKKGVTVPWNDFVNDAEQKSACYAPPNSRGFPRKSSNWADEADDDDPRKEKVVLPSGPRATWGLDLDENKIPKTPPFLAYISNLPFEVEEDEIELFFKDMKIVNVRLPRDDRPGRHRGFGYVEFETRQCLIDALTLPDTNIKGRRIRIEIAAENDRRRGRDGMRSGFSGFDPDRSGGDWRAGPREGPLGEDSRRGFGFSRDREGGSGFITRDRDSGFMSRDGPRREFGSGGFREGFDRDRGSGFRDGGREGFGDRDRDRGGSWFADRDDRDRGRGFSDRDSFGGDRERGRFGDREREGGFGPPRRDFGRDNFRSEPRDDLPPVDRAGEERARPRLNLQPRTKPVEEVAAPAPAPAAPTGAPASIFGGAKPVDTAAREREIEERLAKERSERGDDRPRGRDGSRGPRDGSQGPRDGSRGPRDDSRGPAKQSDRENFWSQRSRQNGPPDNGRTSPHSDNSDQDARRDHDDTERRYRSTPDMPEEGNRSDDRHSENRSASQHSNYEHDESVSHESEDSGHPERDNLGPRERDDLGPREERGRASRARPGPPDTRGSSHSSTTPERSSRGERPKSRGDSQNKDGDNHDDKGEPRLPKLREQEAPNFVGSNKFAYLHSDDEDQE